MDVRLGFAEFDAQLEPFDVRLGWCEFDSQAEPFDVRLAWVEFDGQAEPFGVYLGWVEFDNRATVTVPKYERPGGGYYAPGQLVRYHSAREKKYTVPIELPATATEADEEEMVITLLMEIAARELA